MGLTFRYDSIQLFDTKFEYKEDEGSISSINAKVRC